METPRPNADLILTDFFDRKLEHARGIAEERILRVRARLAECIAAEGDALIEAADRRILEAERQFDPDTAFERTMHAEQLLWVLATFLLEEWSLPDPLARRVQLDVVAELTDEIVYTGLVCVGCESHSLFHIRDELAKAREALRQRLARNRGRRK